MSQKKRIRGRPQNLVGKVIVGMYPRHNFQGVPTYCERRQVLVVKVRVLRREPLDALTPTINPLLNRGDTLITGTDLDKHEERSFYLESFRVWESFDYEPPAAPNPAEAVLAKPAHLKPAPAKQVRSGQGRANRGQASCRPLRRRGA